MFGNSVLVALLAAIPTASAAVETDERPPHEVRQDVHTALRSQASTTGAAQETAVHQLLALYHELQASTRFSESAQKQLSGLVRNRLQRIQRTLARDAEQPLDRSAPADSPPQRALLAQIPGIRAAQAPQPAPAAGNLPPQRAFGNRAGQVNALNAATARNAENLIELIETTIAPKSWQSVGGPGTIVFFSPSQVLVVRQTDGVHAQVGAAIQNLRVRQP
jgi:hypothetical protein